MPKGESGRVVIEVDPDLKRSLYAALAGDGSTLKDWFLGAVASYLAEQEQPSFPDLIHKKRSRAKKT
jgi:hypothetical protein